MFVVVGHSMILVPMEHKRPIQIFILDGVSIFFVLSGFLIGGILIRLLEKNKPDWKLLLNFWNRRWLRTLPMYFFVLLILIIFTAIMKPERLPESVWKYFLFLQNFNTPQPAFFSESWSLSVEEWFYLLIPLLIFAVLNFFKMSVKKTFIAVMILAAVTVTLHRYLIFDVSEMNSAADGIHFLMQVSTRLDAIIYGVLAAFLAHYYKGLWQMMNHFVFVVIGFTVLYMIKLYLDETNSVWIPIYKSLAVMIMLPFFSNWKVAKNKITSFITFISLISYSIYLVNLNIVIYILIKFVWNDNLLNRHTTGPDWVTEYILFWMCTISISFLTYKLIEVPFMNLRKKER